MIKKEFMNYKVIHIKVPLSINKFFITVSGTNHGVFIFRKYLILTCSAKNCQTY